MARFGIEIRNRDGDVLIDGERPHPYLLSEREISLPAGSTNGMGIIFTFAPPGEPFVSTPHPVIVAFSLDAGYVSPVWMLKDDDEWVTCYVSVPSSQSAQTAYARVYHVPPAVPSMGKYGIDIFDAQGERIFSGSQPTLRVHAMGIAETNARLVDTFEFPPTPHRPFIFLSTRGLKFCLWDLYHSPQLNDEYLPFLGPVEKNQEGLYYRFWAGGHRWNNSYGADGGYSTFRMPYVVFT